MTNITLNTATRKCSADKYFLGYEGENNINKLVFKFEDGFRDGLGILNIKREEETGYLDLTKVGDTYELEVKSALLSKIGEITFQLSINEPDGTVIKYDTFTMVVKDAIDADSEMPEDYPNWVDMANAKLAEVDEAISDVETAIQNANGVADTLLQARQNGEFDGRDGEDGTDGVSPVVTTQQTSTGSTITITDAVGTHTATLSNGRDGTDGVDGISSEVSVKTNTETEYVLTITDKNGSFDTPNLKGKDSEGGIVNETDPIYLADKPNLALKTEIPTKTSQLANDSYFATETFVSNKIAEAELSGGDVDLSGYATKDELNKKANVEDIPTKVSDLTNDSNYITSYTETDPTVPSHVKAITETDITNWNNKSNFSGSYNDLTDKPTIPSIEGLATTEQLTQGLATKQDTLTAGNNITIENGVISASGSGTDGGVGKAGSGTNSEIFNDYTNNIVTGRYGHAEGYMTKVYNAYGHAEGGQTQVSGDYGHAEGGLTQVTANYGHSEGYRTYAKAQATHAEGAYCEASGKSSHAEGYYTNAQTSSQHVQGEYNILDTEGSATERGKYAHIVGNGTAENSRSNAHTLDWNGLGWFAGGLKVGGIGQDDTAAKEVATTEYVDNAIAELGGAGGGRAYFNYDKVEAPVTDTFLPLTNTNLKGIELDSNGNPILKAGKSYKVTFNVYTCNIPNVVDNRFLASITNGTSTRTNVAIMYPVLTAEKSNGQSTSNYVGVINPITDFSLEVWARHANDENFSVGCTALRFNLLIDELI